MADIIRDVPITVRSPNIQPGTALPARVRATVSRIATKYLGRASGSSVYFRFRREGRFYRCVVNIDMGTLDIVTGKVSAFNYYFTFYSALRKATKQLRRIKRMLRDDKRGRLTRTRSPPLLYTDRVKPMKTSELARSWR
jgi:ribosome-associated translation inhibitor RaiA